MLRRNKIISLILFVFLYNTEYVNSQNCVPNTTNGELKSCGIESSKICSTPYIYQYDVSDINQYNIILFGDYFSSSGGLGNWQPSSAITTLSLPINRLKIEKTGGGSGTLGAFRTFPIVAGRDYILTASVDKGTCNGANNNIEINIRDVNSIVVATTTVSSNGVSQINIPFTATSAGNYTVEFIRVGSSNAACEFFIDDVVVAYSRCADGLYLHNWHHFYVDNSSLISMVITDNTSSLAGARLYGPFLDDTFSGVCNNIQSGSILPIDQQLATSGTVNLASNLSTGWYLLDVIDDDCIGCIEIDVTEGTVTCSSIICPTDITIDCDASNPNLVINGDFEVGNFAETTTSIESDYSYDSHNTISPNDGSYTITQGPWTITTGNTPVNNHTPSVGSNGFFMHIHDDATNPNDFAWKRTISPIQPNTQYTFEYWFYLHQDETANITHENINLYVNGELISSIDRSERTPYEWHHVKGLWNSGNNTIAELKIEVKVNQGGGSTNDDGRMIFDDISFQEICNKCAESEVHFIVNSTFDLSNITLSWDFGDGTPVSENGNHIYSTSGTYIVTATVNGIEGCNYTTSTNITIKDCLPPPPPCEDCIGSFRPIPDQKYIISAWVKEAGAPLTKTSYDKPIIQMHFYDASHNELPQIAEFKASGMIIDGWQRIEEEFFVPAPTHYIAIELLADGVDAYFDDIRVFPFDASMKSYVYDPINMRLVAELDERHYATFYEYDEEGKLIRIKKETEKGVMTIQETRNSTKKQ